MKRQISKQDIVNAILAWPGRYETPDGRKFLGTPVSQIPERLRAENWRGVAYFDDRSTLRSFGLEIVEARYIGGARPKRFCAVVVAQDLGEPIRDLLLAGYQVEHVPEFAEETGDAENGPDLDYVPAHDLYRNERWTVIVEAGRIVHRELRDLEMEKFCAEAFPPEPEPSEFLPECDRCGILKTSGHLCEDCGESV